MQEIGLRIEDKKSIGLRIEDKKSKSQDLVLKNSQSKWAGILQLSKQKSVWRWLNTSLYRTFMWIRKMDAPSCQATGF